MPGRAFPITPAVPLPTELPVSMADRLGVVPSGSLSLLSTVPVASDPEVAAIVSSAATGASLAPETRKDIVATS